MTVFVQYLSIAKCRMLNHRWVVSGEKFVKSNLSNHVCHRVLGCRAEAHNPLMVMIVYCTSVRTLDHVDIQDVTAWHHSPGVWASIGCMV